MNFRYDKQDDVLMIWFSKEPVDYAEKNKNVIVHFSKKNTPILVEILDASKMLKETIDSHTLYTTPEPHSFVLEDSTRKKPIKES